ncbi:MAG: hypothetical protein ABWX92_16295, partial [Mycetocola sp.]
VPAGTWHNVTNIGDEPLRLYTVYAPVHHAAGALQATAEDAVREPSTRHVSWLPHTVGSRLRLRQLG